MLEYRMKIYIYSGGSSSPILSRTNFRNARQAGETGEVPLVAKPMVRKQRGDSGIARPQSLIPDRMRFGIIVTPRPQFTIAIAT